MWWLGSNCFIHASLLQCSVISKYTFSLWRYLKAEFKNFPMVYNMPTYGLNKTFNYRRHIRLESFWSQLCNDITHAIISRFTVGFCLENRPRILPRKFFSITFWYQGIMKNSDRNTMIREETYFLLPMAKVILDREKIQNASHNYTVITCGTYTRMKHPWCENTYLSIPIFDALWPCPHGFQPWLITDYILLEWWYYNSIMS